MATFIMTAIYKARNLIGNPPMVLPHPYKNWIDFLFDKRQLTLGNLPTGRGCRKCGKIGHKIKECPMELARRQGMKDRRQVRDNQKRNELPKGPAMRSVQDTFHPGMNNGPYPMRMAQQMVQSPRGSQPFPGHGHQMTPPRHQPMSANPLQPYHQSISSLNRHRMPTTSNYHGQLRPSPFPHDPSQPTNMRMPPPGFPPNNLPPQVPYGQGVGGNWNFFPQ